VPLFLPSSGEGLKISGFVEVANSSSVMDE